VPSYEYIQALEDCELIAIGFHELEKLFQTHIEYERVGRLMTLKYLRIWTRQLRNIRMLSAAERYKDLLEKQPELLQRVPQQYLASYLDMLPETLSRMRRKLL
jgi:CRP-like cAMP-binding protein